MREAFPSRRLISVRINPQADHNHQPDKMVWKDAYIVALSCEARKT